MDVRVNWGWFGGSLVYLGSGLTCLFLVIANLEHSRAEERLRTYGVESAEDLTVHVADRTFEYLTFAGCGFLLAVIGALLLVAARVGSSGPEPVGGRRAVGSPSR